MRIVLYILISISILVSIFWWFDEKGYEPIIVAITCFVTLIYHSKSAKEEIQKKKNSLESFLSKNNNVVLDEIQLHVLRQAIDDIINDKKSGEVVEAIESGNINKAIELLKNDVNKDQKLLIEKWRKIGVLSFFTDTNESMNAFKMILSLDECNLEARLVYADLLIRIGKYQKVIELLSKKGKTKELKLEAMTYRTLGIAYRYLGELEYAEEMYNKGLSIANSINNIQIEAEILNGLGLIYKIKGNYSKAKDTYNKSILLMDESSKNISVVYGNLAVIYKYEGNFKEAKNYYIKALEIDTKNKNNDGCARHYGNLGNIYREEKDLLNADKYYKKSLDLYKKLGSKKNIAVCFINIGVLSHIQDNIDDALKNFKAGLSISEEIKHKEGIGLAKYNIGLSLIDIKNIDEAVKYLNSSLSIYQELSASNKVEEIKSVINNLYN